MARSFLASLLLLAVGISSADAQGFVRPPYYRGYGRPPGPYRVVYVVPVRVNPGLPFGNPGGLLNGGPPGGQRGIPGGWYGGYGGYPIGVNGYGTGFGPGSFAYPYPSPFVPW
jgi:hypothetical protein